MALPGKVSHCKLGNAPTNDRIKATDDDGLFSKRPPPFLKSKKIIYDSAKKIKISAFLFILEKFRKMRDNMTMKIFVKAKPNTKEEKVEKIDEFNFRFLRKTKNF